MNHVALVTINFNSENETIALLKSIETLISENVKLSVYVVDNASKDVSVTAIKNFIEQQKKKVDYTIVFIENSENKGFSGGNNVGMRRALSDTSVSHLLLVNNDTLLDKKIVMELLQAMEDTSVGLVSPKIYFAKGYEYHATRYANRDRGNVLWYAGGVIDWANVIGFHRGVDEVDRGQYDKKEEVDFASGCCMLIRRSVVEKIGLLEEKFFLYYEDSDYSMRARRAGFHILYWPKAKMWHKNAGSSGGSGSSLQDYYITRNRLFFGMCYGSFRAKVALLKESISLLRLGRPWQRKGIMDFYFSRWGKGSFAV